MENIGKVLEEYFRDPWRIFRFLNNRGFLNYLSDEMYLRIMYRQRMGKRLDLKNPKTFNEKLQWLKLYDRKPEYTTMVDKYEVKKYVADRIGEEYIIPTLGVWDRFEDIDFDSLPDQFVLKCTHDSGGLAICRDKKAFNEKAAKAKIDKSLKRNYYYSGREWAYKNVKPRIIAEQYMEENNGAEKAKDLVDYKFYCFNGEPRFLYVSQGLENHATARISFLTLDWRFAPYERSDYAPFEELPEKPKNYDDMLRICKMLSKDIPFLRVDLYEINGHVYFSELTFSPCSGFMPFKNPEHDLEIGEMIQLPIMKQ